MVSERRDLVEPGQELHTEGGHGAALQDRVWLVQSIIHGICSRDWILDS